MRIVFAVGLCVLGIVPLSQGQGTIALNNFSATLGRVWTNSLAGAGITQNTNGGVLAAAGYQVELMYAPIGGSNFTSARIFTSATGGGQFFDGTTVILSGIPAGTGNNDTNSVQLFLRAWTGAFPEQGLSGLTGIFFTRPVAPAQPLRPTW